MPARLKAMSQTKTLLLTVLIAALGAALTIGSGSAQLPGPKEIGETAPAAGSPDAVMAASPSCREATNQCQVCVRGRDGRAACSLPGIACQPASWQCTNASAVAPDSPAPLPPTRGTGD